MKNMLSTTHLSLRRRVWMAASLISVIPAIVILNYFFGYYISLFVTLVLVFLIILGWWIIIEISNSIHKIHNQSKKTLETIGEATPFAPDEVKNLEQVINLLSSKVKNGLEELKNFGYKTEELNREVSKKVLVLSTILQANDLYSKDTPAAEVVQFLMHHLKNLLSMDIAFCVLQSHYSERMRAVASVGLDSESIERLIDHKKHNIPHIKKKIVIDSQNKAAVHLRWAEYADVNNFILFPVISKGKTIGFVAAGINKNQFTFAQDDIDVLNLFSQNITLVWEYERVSSRVEQLEMFDDLTGFYNENMIQRKLNDEIRRGVVYQRPCGFVAVKIKNYPDYQKEYGLIKAEKAIKKVAKGIKINMRSIDVGGRIAPDALAVILIEKNKRESQSFSDKLRESLEKDCSDRIKLDFCVAESPVDGVTAEEILSFIQAKLR